MSFRAIAGIQEVFLSFNIREKNNIDSPLLISGITENENNKEKERKHWIPNQVGDDRSLVIPHLIQKHFLSFRSIAGIQEVFLHSHVNGNPGIKESGSPIKLGMTVE